MTAVISARSVVCHKPGVTPAAKGTKSWFSKMAATIPQDPSLSEGHWGSTHEPSVKIWMGPSTSNSETKNSEVVSGRSMSPCWSSTKPSTCWNQPLSARQWGQFGTSCKIEGGMSDRLSWKKGQCQYLCINESSALHQLQIELGDLPILTSLSLVKKVPLSAVRIMPNSSGDRRSKLAVVKAASTSLRPWKLSRLSICSPIRRHQAVWALACKAWMGIWKKCQWRPKWPWMKPSPNQHQESSCNLPRKAPAGPCIHLVRPSNANILTSGYANPGSAMRRKVRRVFQQA